MGRKKRIPNPDEPPIPRKPRTRVGATKKKAPKPMTDKAISQAEVIMGYGTAPKPISLKSKAKPKAKNLIVDESAESAKPKKAPKPRIVKPKPEKPSGMAEFIWQTRFDSK